MHGPKYERAHRSASEATLRARRLAVDVTELDQLVHAGATHRSMWPFDRMMVVTARPAYAAFRNGEITPPYFWFTIGAAIAKKTRMNVPTNSAPSCTNVNSFFYLSLSP
ncbi:Nip3a [Hordeum vulgare]|nr:Nip3a [Hordeum vulgare]